MKIKLKKDKNETDNNEKDENKKVKKEDQMIVVSNQDVEIEEVSAYKPKNTNELKRLADYNVTPTMTKVTQEQYKSKLRSHDQEKEVHFVYYADHWNYDTNTPKTFKQSMSSVFHHQWKDSIKQ